MITEIQQHLIDVANENDLPIEEISDGYHTFKELYEKIKILENKLNDR